MEKNIWHHKKKYLIVTEKHINEIARKEDETFKLAVIPVNTKDKMVPVEMTLTLKTGQNIWSLKQEIIDTYAKLSGDNEMAESFIDFYSGEYVIPSSYGILSYEDRIVAFSRYKKYYYNFEKKMLFSKDIFDKDYFDFQKHKVLSFVNSRFMDISYTPNYMGGNSEIKRSLCEILRKRTGYSEFKQAYLSIKNPNLAYFSMVKDSQLLINLRKYLPVEKMEEENLYSFLLKNEPKAIKKLIFNNKKKDHYLCYYLFLKRYISNNDYLLSLLMHEEIKKIMSAMTGYTVAANNKTVFNLIKKQGGEKKLYSILTNIKNYIAGDIFLTWYSIYQKDKEVAMSFKFTGNTQEIHDKLVSINSKLKYKHKNTPIDYSCKEKKL